MPGPVQNLNVLFLADSATFDNVSRTYDLNITISWEVPLDPGGEILTYSYSVEETGSPGSVIINESNTTMLSVERNVQVAPFTSYTVTVVVYTRVGRGVETMQAAESPEAGLHRSLIYRRDWSSSKCLHFVLCSSWSSARSGCLFLVRGSYLQQHIQNLRYPCPYLMAAAPVPQWRDHCLQLPPDGDCWKCSD